MIMTKEQFAAFRKEIETALAPIAAKYGTKVTAENIKYDDIITTVSVSFRTETADKSADQINFEKHAAVYGFKAADFGFTFTDNGKTHRFVSFKTTARKYPCVCECSDGKKYAFTTSDMHLYMELAKKGE